MQLGDCPPGEMRKRGMAILDRLGMADRADYKPRALSGGQRQRVAVARALVNRPRLVLADEPTAALDRDSSGAVVKLLKELTLKEACTIMMVTHDNRILELADRVVNVVDGRIISDVTLREAVVICELLRGIELFSHLPRPRSRGPRKRYGAAGSPRTKRSSGRARRETNFSSSARVPSRYGDASRRFGAAPGNAASRGVLWRARAHGR